MSYFAPIAAAALAMLGAVPAVAAAQGGPYYSATPTAAPTKASVITRGSLWKCAEGVCTSGKSSDRPATMCELVVQRVGTVSAFTANGTTFDADALTKCNARAK